MAADKVEKGQDRAPESDPFLTAVDAKIGALQALRASYLAAVSIGAFGQSGDPASFSVGGVPTGSMGFGGAPLELPRGALLGKSIPAAIKLYLSAVKKKQTIREIANALREGGVETTAKNFETPVQSAIYRLQATGDVLRFKEGWALAEFYPESLRNRIAQDSKQPKKTTGKAGRARKRTTKKATSTAETKRIDTSPAQQGGQRAVAVRLLTESGSRGMNIPELFAAIQKTGVTCERKYVRGILSKLYLDGKADKRDGRYVLKATTNTAAA